jgi:hypothetical protein
MEECGSLMTDSDGRDTFSEAQLNLGNYVRPKFVRLLRVKSSLSGSR